LGWKAVREKRAIVILELIDESLGQRNDLIVQELLLGSKKMPSPLLGSEMSKPCRSKRNDLFRNAENAVECSR
jgi:hypothetical protein